MYTYIRKILHTCKTMNTHTHDFLHSKMNKSNCVCVYVCVCIYIYIRTIYEKVWESVRVYLYWLVSCFRLEGFVYIYNTLVLPSSRTCLFNNFVIVFAIDEEPYSWRTSTGHKQTWMHICIVHAHARAHSIHPYPWIYVCIYTHHTCTYDSKQMKG